VKVCAVTCTGGRPELFELCKRWVMRQTRMPDRWIVSTDIGGFDSKLPEFASHYTHDPQVEQEPNPHRRAHFHLASALKCVPPDHAAVIMEDDDWYGPDHIETLVEHLERSDCRIASHRLTRFYHVPERRYLIRPSEGRSDIGIVMLSPEAIPWYVKGLIETGAQNEYYLLSRLQSACKSTSVGIKGAGFGLPGRAGASSKHQRAKALRIMQADPGAKMFREWLGPDAQPYLDLAR
jgi:hypothetical protein